MRDATILLIEPFLGGSHRVWAETWQERSRHHIEILGHEGRHWRWRMRGSAVTIARAIEARAHNLEAIDVVVASNMVDLAGLLGLARRQLGAVPVVQYLHENQLSYPRQVGESLDSGLAWMQWRGLVAADEIWCNSAFHRDELVSGVDALLADAHDHSHDAERAALLDKLQVFVPGVDIDACRRGDRTSNERPLVLSNQRWHHDKDVGAVVRALGRLSDRGVSFDLAIVGDHEGGEAEVIDPLLDRLGERVVERGHLPRDDYLALLRRVDVVVSAARGENFGIAVVEAIAAGAWPVLPNALVYPELIPEPFHEATLYEPGDLGRRLAASIEGVAAGHTAVDGLAEAMDPFDVGVVTAAMDDRIDQLLAV